MASIPRHSWHLGTVIHVVERSIERVEVANTGIAVVFSRPNFRALSRFCRVIHQYMLRRIPSTEAEIKTTDTCTVMVDDDQFLVVRPEQRNVFGSYVIGVALLIVQKRAKSP